MFYISKNAGNEFQQDHSQMTECSTLGEFVLGNVKIPLAGVDFIILNGPGQNK